MEQIPHNKDCQCNFCINKQTPKEYAIHHAGFFNNKESCLMALDQTMEVVIENSSEFPEYLNFWECVRHETEKFDDKSDVWKKRGIWKNEFLN